MLHPLRTVHPVRGAARARRESRWPAAATIVVAIALQITLPEHLVPPLRWLLPGWNSPRCWS